MAELQFEILRKTSPGIKKRFRCEREIDESNDDAVRFPYPAPAEPDMTDREGTAISDDDMMMNVPKEACYREREE
jgi:hypothetical protein